METAENLCLGFGCRGKRNFAKVSAFMFVGFSNREAIYDVFAFIMNIQQQLIVTDILLIRVALMTSKQTDRMATGRLKNLSDGLVVLKRFILHRQRRC